MPWPSAYHRAKGQCGSTKIQRNRRQANSCGQICKAQANLLYIMFQIWIKMDKKVASHLIDTPVNTTESIIGTSSLLKLVRHTNQVLDNEPCEIAFWRLPILSN
jgi:hypothetical protein